MSNSKAWIGAISIAGPLTAAAPTLGSVTSGSITGGAFSYVPIVEPIVSASFGGNFAALTAQRNIGPFETNFMRLTDMEGFIPTTDLSDALFGPVNSPPVLDQGQFGTGLIEAPIDPAFFPALSRGNIGLIGLLSDTFDSAFAIDYLRLNIVTIDTTYTFYYGSTPNGFGIGLPPGTPLPGPVFQLLPYYPPGHGFDGTIGSKYFLVPSPGAAVLALGALAAATARRRRRSIPGAMLALLVGATALFASAPSAQAGPGGPTTQGDVAIYVRDQVLGGSLGGKGLWMTDGPHDASFIARDIYQDSPDIPFPPGDIWWLVMVDDEPGSNWAHPNRWVFVNDDLTAHTFPLDRDWNPSVWGNAGAGPPATFGCVDIVALGGMPCAENSPPPVLPFAPAHEKGAGTEDLRADQSCLHAVLFSGGFNDGNNHKRYADNLKKIFKKLRACGFPYAQTWVYYANGQKLDLDNADNDNDDNTGSDIDGKATKTNIRNRISGFCTSLNPKKDVLFVYVTNHGINGNGAVENGKKGIALWDFNGNGKVDNDEVYTPTEFAADTKNCKVCRIFVIMDQCHSGLFLPLATDGNHKNMGMYVAAKAEETSKGSQYMDKWLVDDPATKDMNKQHPAALAGSTPGKAEGTAGNGNTPLCFCWPDPPLPAFPPDQLHCYGPHFFPLADLGQPFVGVYATVEQQFVPQPGPIVRYERLAGDFIFLTGTPDGPDAVLYATSARGDTDVSIYPGTDGVQQLMRVSVVDTPLVNYVVFGQSPILPPLLATDLNRDGQVNTADLVRLLSHFGGWEYRADINQDGTVDTRDLVLMLADFGH